MNPEPKKKSNVGKIISTIVIIAIAAVGFVYHTTISDYIMAIGYEPTTEMASVINDLDLTGVGKRIMMASRPEIQSADVFNNNCPGNADSATLGCYYMNSIFIYDVQNSELAGIKQAVAAHELLHAVWARMSESERQDITDDLQNVYLENSTSLKAHMENYDKDSELDELHSVIGTEIPPSKYPSALKKHYVKYFTNQQKIYAYFEQYYEKFSAIQARNAELDTIIKGKQAKLDLDTETYLNNFNQLNSDIDAFNAKNAAGGFSSEYQFNLERNALLARRDALQKDYDALIKLTDEINEYINEYNQNITRSNQLYDSVNSRVTKPGNL